MHEPIRFQNGSYEAGKGRDDDPRDSPRPLHLDLKKDKALTIRWSDGRISIYPIAYLRKMSPSADAKQLREQLARNPLTVLPDAGTQDGPLTATGIEKIGNYAVRILFSDGHHTGIYAWRYLRQIDPNQPTKPDKPDV